ncbi:MFS transporter [Streptomyces aureus]|uniref:MFS transporter n=1 Tax=Streptomyces aureus TaxID=193461 RepID=UPI00055A732C|nr:MFS transporter [Streptomyces aureus]
MVHTDTSTSAFATDDDATEVLKVPDFRRLWAANGFRYAASEVAGFALPVTALLLLHARPLVMSLIFVCSRAGFLTVGLPAGVWIDRWRKKPVMVWADVAYAVAFGSIPVAYFLDALTVAQLIVVALVISMAGVFFEVAHSSVLPYVLPRRRVADGNARLQTSQTALQAISPSVAGVVTQSVAAPVLYCFVGLCHLVSLLLLRRIHPSGDVARGRTTPKREFRREIADGMSVLFKQPLLRLLLNQAALNNVGAGIILAMLPVFLLEEIGISAWLFGLLSTLGALTGFAASLLAPRLRRRFGEIRMAIVFSALAPFAVVAAPLAAVFRDVAVPLIALAEVLIGVAIVGRSVSTAGLRARVTPNAYMGRVTAAYSVVVQGATPLGALAGGLVANHWSTGTALWAGAVAMGVPLVLLLLSPIRHHSRLPEEWEVRG